MSETDQQNHGNLGGDKSVREGGGQGCEDERNPQGNPVEKSKIGSIISNGLEHITHSPTKIAAFAIAIYFSYGFLRGFQLYRDWNTETTALIHKEAPDAPFDRNFTFAEKIVDMDKKQVLFDEQIKKCTALETPVNDMKAWIDARRGKIK